jgi:hypothetical protein
MAARRRDWHTARKPVQAHEVTEQMLAPIRQAAAKSWLPQTVWPSKWYGNDFMGTDCLLVSAASALEITPANAAENSAPLLTIIPPGYFDNWPQCASCHRYGQGLYDRVNGPYSDGNYYHHACWAAVKQTPGKP